jgi:Transposase DNA-binding/Transposase DDE domain
MASRRRVEKVSAEFESAELGDERLTRRLLTIADAAAASPASSFPAMTSSDGELEGVYRFLSNERVSPEKILAPHFAATTERGQQEKDVLAIHDSTLFRFGGESRREGLGWLHKQDGSQGFLGHFALAVSGDGSRRPLGLAGLSTIVRSGTPLGRKVTGRKRVQRTGKESLRWTQLALQVHEKLPDAIHVMDREGDSFEIYEALVNAGAHFIIRGRIGQNRVVVEDGLRVQVTELVNDQPVRLRRTVPLARRTAGRRVAAAKKIHPPRSEREATLEIRCRRVSLPRPYNQSRLTYPRELELNIVWVTETGQPVGEEPVEWMLVTDLPITSERDLERIIDAYRARWVIEEFFKALKTGCAFEKRQLESFSALMNALALFCVIAWRLLVLRTAARDNPSGRAEDALTARQVRLLRALPAVDETRFRRVKLPSRATAKDVLLAVAGLGGHLTKNGFPGWEVLNRGYEALLLLELGWRARDAM